ncbi:MAG TPA: hypothetical protein VGS20_13810 [Candidatus Acidoferrales bacterium]|nr:hypothetical protein [Candidatus Acidoferrales bacterium]
MAIDLARRIVFAAMGAWLLVMAAEQFRLSGHTAPAVGFGVVGIALGILAITGKGG